MSQDVDTQHFGQPEEPGTPGVQRYRKARAALAAAEKLQPTLQGTHALVNYDLMQALKAFMPTYRILETSSPKGRIVQLVVAKGLESREAAQQWIADNDPAARRMFHIETEEKSL